MAEQWFDNEHPSLRKFWHPVAAVDEIDRTRPHPFRLLGQDYVLANIGGGARSDGADAGRDSSRRANSSRSVGLASWAAVPAACPHRLAPLDAGRVVDGRIVCGYHGWCFDSSGTCVEIPALGAGATIPPTAHLTAAHGVEERYGLIWVALDNPVATIPNVAEWDDDRFGHAPMPRQEWSASAAQMTDNFLDVAHFPFTHLDTIGNPDEIEVHNFDIDGGDWYFDATYAHTARLLSESADDGAANATVVERVMRFRCWAPHHLKLLIDYGPDGDLLLLFFHQPIDATTTGLHCIILAENIATGEMTAQDQIDFQYRVASEDRDMLERMARKAIPLHPGVETHTRADRATVELRRLLAKVAGLID